MRARLWAARARSSPGRVEWLFANQEAVNASLRESATALAEFEIRLDRLDGRALDLSQEGRAGVTAIGDEIHRLRADMALRLDGLDRALTGQAQMLNRAVATPARDAERARILAELGPSPSTRPGLSILTICWNHGGLLSTAVASGLAVLDALPVEQQGQVLILDDGSADETAAVAAGLAADDPRARVVTASRNLGVSRARNVLLHTVATRHAFLLDADNSATPGGVAALLSVAVAYDAAFTYGNVLKRDGDGNPVGYMSNEPLTQPWFRGNYIDTMAVVDVDRLRDLGGWPEDPAVEHLDDWALVHRLARAGELIGFVPVVVGRYSELEHGFHRSVPDARIGPDRIARTWNADGRLTPDSVAAFAAHPRLGPLWAAPAAVARRPELGLVAGLSEPVPAPERPRLLVVGPGGVANLGDDAIVAAALDRLGHLLPDHDLDVVTDGPEPVTLGRGVLWMGPLLEVVRGLGDDDFADDLDPELVTASASIGVGSQSYRSLEPGGYVGAVFLGGGTLTSLWEDTLVAPRSLLAAALRHAGVPYSLSGQGIGPLGERGTNLVRLLIAGATRCSVRDAPSAAVIPGSGPQVTGDDALLLAAADEGPVAAALHRSGVDGPYVAVSVREADYVGTSVDRLERWAQAVDDLAHARGLMVLGVALNDHPEHAEVVTLSRLAHGATARRARWRTLECGDDPALLAGVMAGAEAAIVHSYHAALFALRATVPTVLMANTEYYERKASGLAALAGLPDAFVGRADESDDLSLRLDMVAKALAAGNGLDPAKARVDAWWSAMAAGFGAPAEHQN